MERLTLDELRRHRERLLALAARHGASRVRVFGSVARREAGAGSDVDFLVEMAPGRSLLDLGALQMDFADTLGRAVDVISERGLKARHWERILEEALPL